MVEISLSGSGEGPGWATAPGYSTAGFSGRPRSGSIHAVCFWYYREDLLERLGWPGRIALVSAVVMAIAIFGATSRPFIYFQF